MAEPAIVAALMERHQELAESVALTGNSL